MAPTPSPPARPHRRTAPSDRRPGVPTDDEPVAVALELAGCRFSDYELLLATLELEPGGPALPNCLVHWVERSPTGIRIREIWSSRRAFEFVLIEFVLPALSILALPAPRIELHTALALTGSGGPIAVSRR